MMKCVAWNEPMKPLPTQDERFNRRKDDDFERPIKVMQQDTS